MSYGRLTADDYWLGVPPDTADVADPYAGPVADQPYLGPSGLTVLPASDPPQVRRSIMIPIVFSVPTLVAGLSYLSGGVPALTDLALLVLTALCVYLLGVELATFRRRMGIGAILIYAGVLIWFVHDYLANWLGRDFNHLNPDHPSVTADTVARAMFYHGLFVQAMLVAYRLPVLRFLERLVTIVPEPANPGLYLWIVITALAVGSSSLAFTTDPWPVAVFRHGFWFLPGVGPVTFTVGRTNLATSWGSYVAQLLQVGQVSGLMGAVYALLVARTTAGRLFGWLVWAYWASSIIPTQRRGDMAFMALPVIGLVFLKFAANWDAAHTGRNLAWLGGVAFVTLGMWVAVQWQSGNRMGGGTQLFRAAGNTMFSEGLDAWQMIPGRVGFVYDTWPGAAIVRPIPDTVWAAVTGPIPRMIWPGKPVESFALWYSALISHDNRGVLSGGSVGTTVSSGAVGYWYFRYGPPGVVEGGFVYGVLMGLAERSLRRAQGRPMKVLFTMAFAAFIFRSYRDLWWHNLDPVIIGAAVMFVIVRFVLGARADDDVPIPGSSAPARNWD